MLQKHLGANRGLWVMLIFFGMISLLLVYSSVMTLAYRFHQGNTEFYLLKHAAILLFGLTIGYTIQKVKYVFWGRISVFLYIFILPLLAFTLFNGISVGEASRWLEIPGINLSFQPSDPAKLILILFTCRNIVKYPEALHDFKKFMLRFILPAVLMCLFIFPANLSTAILIFLNTILILWISGASIKNLFYLFLILTVIGIVFFTLIWFVPEFVPRGKTWKSRIENFSNEKSSGNYQAEQAKIAIASGGLVFGKGPGNSIQRAFLPQASSDFIFAIMVEEYGVLISILVLFFYLILLYKGIQIYRSCEHPFGATVALGLVISIVVQALVNMMVAVNLIPVTGQPLPLISMGGTSIWFTMVAMGIIMSINNKIHQKKESEISE
ncbi:MAG: FtsW/RodA/SpoVE family cell cycle protein [Bacteroidia bacterium]|nr:FtsW/RodA/SpoVE family cell cycle protein [Bacteroidia bacterium]